MHTSVSRACLVITDLSDLPSLVCVGLGRLMGLMAAVSPVVQLGLVNMRSFQWWQRLLCTASVDEAPFSSQRSPVSGTQTVLTLSEGLSHIYQNGQHDRRAFGCPAQCPVLTT